MSLLDIIPGQRGQPRPAARELTPRGVARTTTPKPIRKPGNPATQFPMMCAAAEAMGIHRVTLYRVLKGQFPDRGDYAARYRAFVAQNSKAAA